MRREIEQSIVTGGTAENVTGTNSDFGRLSDMDAFTNRLGQYVSTAQDVSASIRGLNPTLQNFKAGTDIVRAGDPTGTLFVIQNGWAIRYREIDDGRRQILNFMLPGDIFDLQALGDLKADHSVAALDDVEVWVFSARDFLSGLKQSGPVATAFWWSAVQEESILREQIVRIGQLSAKERIGHLLLELQRRLSIVLGVETLLLRLPVTRSDIGDALGLTPVHVSRTISGMKRMELIEEDRSSLRIINRDKLREMSKFDPDYLHISRLDLETEIFELPATNKQTG
ncbi:MAG: Crp/Fnr family transcriptional regulator [Pseudomonadota bacterium]